MVRKIAFIVLLIAATAGLTQSLSEQVVSIPAFPGAEGAGAFTPGGRGGKVFAVTNLNDSGPGSLREAVEADGPRIIIFHVSGIITLEKPLSITNPYITIAGQTAPGDGICIRSQTTEINTHDVVLRYLRFRRGNLEDRNDALGGYPERDIIVDHCSAGWGLDENLSLYRYKKRMPDDKEKKMPVENLTIQWCISSEALDLHNHAFGATWGGKNCSFHHNLFACNTGRNPSIGWGDHFDFRNNVLFNWRHRTIDGGDGSSNVNIVANYFKPGPAVRGGRTGHRICMPQHLERLSESQQGGKWYVADNFVLGNPQVTADNWNGGVQFEDVKSQEEVNALIEQVRAAAPIAAVPVRQQSAEQAYELVLADVGATLPKRDPVDERIIKSVRTGQVTFGTGIIKTPDNIGGWPNYKSMSVPADSDNDGMPDEWEQKFGLNSNEPADGAEDTDGDGYTNIEEWLNDTNPEEFVDYRKPENNINTLNRNIEQRQAEPMAKQSKSMKRQMEYLDRGVVAVNQGDGNVYVGWRMLGTDPDDIAFNVYRNETRINNRPITKSTNIIDVNASDDAVYTIRAVINGLEGEPSAPTKVWSNNYLSIRLQTPEGYTPNDASVGDLDGDGEYEIVLKQEMTPRDNSHSGLTGQTKLEAYKLNSTFMWRIDLGRNIREGAHYTQFMVYDLDGDGKAEVACKTADGTVDGKGNVIGNADANYVNDRGFILDGPEFLTIFDGQTGAELVTTDYIPPRGGDDYGWGDSKGNRVDRFLACIAYLDGQRPSLVMCRGYYTRAVLAAWNYRDGKLSHLWTFDSDDGTDGNRAYRGQGNHSVSVADVDGDGKDEIIYGACAIDNDGRGLYSTGLGHGDALHVSDIDPDRDGLEIFGIHERPHHPYCANLRDAVTGKILWALQSKDLGRGLAIDIDPRYRGYECWATLESDMDGLYSCKGEKISDSKPPSCNMGVWWDGDVLRELLDGTTIDKWDYKNAAPVRLLTAEDCASNNGTKANPCLCADILGDWREEVIWRTSDNKELRIYTTTMLTDRRFYTFMHDAVYRLSIAWQNVAYNQPAHTGFYMGEDMAEPPRPSIRTVGGK